MSFVSRIKLKRAAASMLRRARHVGIILFSATAGLAIVARPAGAETQPASALIVETADAALANAPTAPLQTPAPDAAAPAAPRAAATQTTPVTAGWQDGFVIQSTNGDYRLTLGLLTQVDGRFDTDTAKPITNTFTIRKARPTLSGRVGRYFDYRFTPDFGNGASVLVDAYIDVRFSSKFRIRTGKDKTPVGYELLIGDAGLLFPERSLASLLVPNRDVGVQAQGDLAGGKVYYAGGVFNGVPDGVSETTEVDTNNGKDFAGRLVIQPFRPKTAAAGGAQTGPGFQIGGSTGEETGALPSFKTSIGQTFFSYTGANAAGKHHARHAGRLSTTTRPSARSLNTCGHRR